MQNSPIQWFARCNSRSVRVERIVHLDSMLVDWEFFGPTRAQLARELSDVSKALTEGGLGLPSIAEARTIEDLENVLHDGVIYKAAALGFPVKACQAYFVIDGDTLGCSWEVSRSQWFYGQTYEDALEKACAWGEAFYEEAWARVRDKNNLPNRGKASCGASLK
ncbi:hypothetical protein [Paraburkholderia caledonica]|uniref:hypothetical protein n=1 Tax=Paraburkholderia caledonica TaxID=134536 RepID=UPI0038BB2837